VKGGPEAPIWLTMLGMHLPDLRALRGERLIMEDQHVLHVLSTPYLPNATPLPWPLPGMLHGQVVIIMAVGCGSLAPHIQKFALTDVLP
jgi:hypothetical protein